VLRTQGWRGLYQGFGITTMREIPFTSLQFPLYEFLKRQLSIRVARKQLYAHEAAMCGCIAGGVAAALTTPLDVLKTRVMLDLRVRYLFLCSLPAPEPDFIAQNTSQNATPALLEWARMIYAEEGLKTLFAGVVPRTLWISAGGAVFLGVYEWAVHGLMDI
jgi:solute carrier family 25 S-adenosylmethionine transporter 26